MKNRFQKAVILCAAAVAVCAGRVQAQGTDTWTNTGGNAWLQNNNWSTALAPTQTQIAEFDANPTGSASSSSGGVAFNFGGSNSANGPTLSGSMTEVVGALTVTSQRQTGIFFGGKGTAGFLILYGATVGGQANTVISDASGGFVSIVPEDQGGASTAPLSLMLNNATNNIVMTSASTLTISTAIVDGTNGATQLNMLGVASGTTILSGTNTFSGGLTLGSSDGTKTAFVQINKTAGNTTAALPTSGTIAVNNNSQLLLNFAGTYGSAGQTLSLSGNGGSAAAGGGALRTNNTGVYGWAGNLFLASGTDQFDSTGSAGLFTIAGSVSGSGTLQKQGSGNLVLAGGASNYSTMVGNGTITVNSGGSLGTGALMLGQGSGDTGGLTLNNAVQTIGSLSSSGTNNTLALNGGTVLTIVQVGNTSFGNSSSTITDNGAANGAGSLVISSSSTGTLTLNGANSYSGGTTINGGTLAIAGDSSLGSGNNVTLNGGRLANISGSSMTIASSRVISLGSAAGTSISAAGGGNVTFNGVLQDLTSGGILVKQGSGTLTLGGANTYTGATTVNNGTLQAAASSLADTAAINVSSGGNLQVTSSFTNNGPLQVAAGSTSPGGTASVTGNYTQSSTGSLNLQLGGASASDGVTTGGDYTHLDVTGSVAASGTFAVSLANGFSPGLGNVFNVINYGSATGNFSSYSGLQSASNMLLMPTFGATSMTLTPTATGIQTSTYQPIASSGSVGVSQGSGYAGLIATEGAAGNATSTAVLDGVASAARTVTESFSPAGSFGAGSGGPLDSDILNFQGTGADTFVLQISYNPALVGGGQTPELVWNDGGTWVNAVLGNSSPGNTPGTEINGAYDPSADFVLGDYGVNTATDTVWAVLDHNSEFGAGIGAQPVPEPATWAGALVAAAGLSLFARRRKAGR